MGCFSFICKKCGKPINSSSIDGENVRLTLLENGKVIEEMQGEYDSYGCVFEPTKVLLSFEWKKEWGKVCDLMFASNRRNGIAATHVFCKPEDAPTERSDDDPNQGWGKIKSFHRGNCEVYHKVFENGK